MVYKKIFEILSNFNFAFTNESGQNFNLSIIAAFMLLTDATNFQRETNFEEGVKIRQQIQKVDRRRRHRWKERGLPF